ncbi:MAG TPA: hypothetical protein VIG33_10715 [Pseudobdellovibrionaceae bacterium]
MNYKIVFLFLIVLQTGCGVELRDRHQPEEINSPTELRIENEYSLPIPLILSQQTVLHYDRLVLGPKAQLITQGLNVRIEVKELIAEDSIIRSFKPDQIAAAGFNGRSGGHLELIAEKATGHLTLIMQGEKGGTGSNGAPADETLRGAKGADGLSAFFDYQNGNFLCIRKATSGSQGGQGLQGFPGGPGKEGGDSGTALVKITETENFDLQIQKNPGRGGDGGPGGEGGPGGFGGEPGRETMPAYNGPDIHTYTAPGSPGIQGPPGFIGKTGDDGAAEKSCVQWDDEVLRCE